MKVQHDKCDEVALVNLVSDSWQMQCIKVGYLVAFIFNGKCPSRRKARKKAKEIILAIN